MINEEALSDLADYLTHHQELLFTIEGSFYVIGSFAAIIAYFWKKDLRRPPGNIFFFIALTDAFIGLRWLVHVWFPDYLEQGSLACNLIGYLGSCTSYMYFAFNSSFIFNHMCAMRYSLRPGRIPVAFFWLIPIFYVGGVLWQRHLEGLRVFKDAMGVCTLKPSAGSRSISSFIIVLVPLLFALYVKIYFYHHINKLRAKGRMYDLLNFQSKYVTLLIVSYLAILYWFFPAYFIPADSRNLIDLSNFLSRFLRFLTIMILLVYRFSDPTFLVAFAREAPPPLLKPPPAEKVIRDVSKETDVSDDQKAYPLLKNSSPRRGTVEIEMPQVDRNDSLDQVKSHMKNTTTAVVVSAVWSYFYAQSLTRDSVLSSWSTPGIAQSIEVELSIKDEHLLFQKDKEQVTTIDFSRKVSNLLPCQTITFTAYETERFQSIVDSRNYHGLIDSSLQLETNMDSIRSELGNRGGRSGEFFFYTFNNRFIIKTLSKADKEALLNIITDYSNYLRENVQSLIIPILGIFDIRLTHLSETITVMLMPHISFGIPSHAVLANYDLKGSSIDRQSIRTEDLLKAQRSKYRMSTVGKDIDFQTLEKSMNAAAHKKDRIIEQMRKDVGFLQANGLMDYSLLFSKVDAGRVRVDDDEEDLRTYYPSNFNFEEEENNYFCTFGIIDYLQEYNMSKKIERFFKILKYRNTEAISVLPPDQYAARFLTKMEAIF